jgi:hypothetical protein
LDEFYRALCYRFCSEKGSSRAAISTVVREKGGTARIPALKGEVLRLFLRNEATSYSTVDCRTGYAVYDRGEPNEMIE